MKKEYEKPELEIIELENDVIVTSGNGDGSEDNPFSQAMDLG